MGFCSNLRLFPLLHYDAEESGTRGRRRRVKNAPLAGAQLCIYIIGETNGQRRLVGTRELVDEAFTGIIVFIAGEQALFV